MTFQTFSTTLLCFTSLLLISRLTIRAENLILAQETLIKLLFLLRSRIIGREWQTWYWLTRKRWLIRRSTGECRKPRSI